MRNEVIAMGTAIDALEACGGRRLGQGAFGAVFTHPTKPERVIKFGCESDDGWPLFAAYCASSTSPHVQKVYTFEWVRDAEGNRLFYRAEMERLACTVSAAAYDSANPLHDRGIAVKLGTHSAYGLSKCGEEEASKIVVELQEKFPGERFDLHNANWMFRADGTLVLIDPFSWSQSESRETIHIIEAAAALG